MTRRLLIATGLSFLGFSGMVLLDYFKIPCNPEIFFAYCAAWVGSVVLLIGLTEK